MTDNTVFQQADQPKVETPNEPSELLGSLVGEGKKFKDAEALAKAKLESDRFIEQIKSENAGLRKELEERTKISQALDEIKKRAEQGNQPHDKPAAIDPNEIKDLVKNTLNETVRENTAKQNVLEAERHVIEKLGSKDAALKFITEKARDLGVSGDWLMGVAASNPKALYSVLGLDGTAKQQPTSPVSPNNPVNTAKKEFVPNGAGPKAGTKEYYDDMRRKEPNKYWSSAVQNEIFKARKDGTYVTK